MDEGSGAPERTPDAPEPRPTWRAWPLIAVFVVLVGVGAFALANPDDGPVTAETASAATDTTLAAVTESMLETTTLPPETTTTAAPAPMVPGPSATVAPIAAVDGAAPEVFGIDTTDPVIFVTIDDGTVADPAVLEYLRTTGMPITMFLNEGPVRTHPEFFEALRQMGNTVNSHTLGHKSLPALSPEQQRAEICGMVDLLNETYGTSGGLFRAPFGRYNLGVRQQAASCGLRATVQWTGTLADGVVTLQEPPLKPGDVIVTHFTPDLLVSLQELKRQADAAGLRIARLDDYLPA
ncbi:MAG: polysaccharide deacetylase family protein [Acidimicrobiales bacterium]|nr:polysaccharide deacetylase family protein [Acidimicrobiales bacterium]